MKVVQTQRARGFFTVVGGTRRSQAATMILRPGQSTGGDPHLGSTFIAPTWPRDP